ncbi:MAG: DUF4345 domain-containing protein [Rhizobiales bacterium]|nr:DUF4345 domain-containing protein [Hyphomicrobiales bacterium]
MQAFIVVLWIISAAFIAVSALHLFLGIGADALLGSPITPEMSKSPSIDSQNRFYGVTFALFGVVLLVSTSNLHRYQPMIVATLAVLFAAGIARAVSWILHGAPSPAIIGILCADLVLPPVLYGWLKLVL